jgi:dethiobiotin synthetase
MSDAFFVTGTDTNVGKTVLSALLVAALDGTYWKPIQTGVVEGTDRRQVMLWAELPESRIVPESYCFDPPVSPHLAAEMAGVTIDLARIRRPPRIASPPLIIEGAGGVMVPINASDLMVDLMAALRAPVVVASRTALGTINHTVLTVRALRTAGLCVQGVVMIGAENKDNERAVERYGTVPVIGRIPLLDPVCRQSLLRVFQTSFDARAFS